jgi:hypothetical protein
MYNTNGTNGASATQPIFRWNGQYFGFMSNGYLMDASGAYRGWIENDGTVWGPSGKFLGDLVGGEYVLLQQSVKRAMKPKRLTPSPVTLPPKPENRKARSARPGYVDGLDACE